MWSTRDCLKNDLNWLIFELSVHYWLPLKIQWLQKYTIDPVLTITHLGWCKTFNIVDRTEMFKLDSTANYFEYEIRLQNLTEFPLTTTKKEVGFHGSIVVQEDDFTGCHFIVECNAASMEKTIVVHSPYEVPSTRHKTINLRIEELAKLAIVPKMKITDATLLHLDIDEYEDSLIYN